MTRLVKLLALLAATYLAGGCATVFNHSPGDVDITTIPEGADVSVDELEVSCQTPCELDVKPDRYEVHLAKKGYKTETVQLVKRISVAFWFNFITGPYCVIGMGIDWLTGSMYKISPGTIKVKLVSLTGEKVEEKTKPKEEEDDGSGTGSDDAAPEADPRPKQGPPPAPKLEADTLPPPEAPPPPPEEPLPPSPEAKKLEGRVPDEYVDREIELYYGALSPKKAELVKRHLYKILLEMQQNGERPDIDEAVKTEKFRYP